MAAGNSTKRNISNVNNAQLSLKIKYFTINATDNIPIIYVHKVHIAFPKLSLPEFLASMITDQGGDILGSCRP